MTWGFVLILLCAANQAEVAFEPQAVSIELFVRADSDVCQKAVAYSKDYATKVAGLNIVVHDVVSDNVALQRYWQFVKRSGITTPVLPGVSAAGQFFVGFDERSFGSKLDELLTIRVFGRETCPHCRDAKRFLADLKKRRPALRVEEFDVVNDAAARRQMEELARKHGKRVTGLPLISAGGTIFIGYQSDTSTGNRIEALFDLPQPPRRADSSLRRSEQASPLSLFAAHSRIVAGAILIPVLRQIVTSPNDDAPPPPPSDLATSPNALDSPPDPDDAIELPYFGQVRLRDWGLPLFTVIVGLVDGFNPCAMWVLVFVLSVLVNVRSRTRILAIAGTFVIVSGMAYFAFMAAWLNIFVLLGLVRPLQIGLGAVAIVVGLLNVKDFFAFKKGFSLSIPEAAKPAIYERVRRVVSAKSLSLAITTAVVLAVMVNVVELLCTAGLPALYGEILSMQRLPGWKNYAYLSLYIAAYMFDDTLLLAGFVITLSHRKLQQREGRWLKLVSGLVILGLGVVMIARPNWLHWTR